MNFANYIFGPQLIGIIMYLIGSMMQKFPPKKINSWYGYRTESSMKNQQTWDEATSYSAKIMTVAGMILIIAGIAFTIAINYLIADRRIVEGLTAGITIISGIIPGVITIAKTESHLDRTFNSKNEIR